MTLDDLKALAALAGYQFTQERQDDGTIIERMVRPDGSVAVQATKRPNAEPTRCRADSCSHAHRMR